MMYINKDNPIYFMYQKSSTLYNKNMQKTLAIILILFINLTMLNNSYGQIEISLFPLNESYTDEKIWLDKSQPEFFNSMIDKTEQNKYFEELKSIYFGTDKKSNSPWSESYIRWLLNSSNQSDKSVYLGETYIINHYISNPYYQFNHRIYERAYFSQIENNMNLNALKNLQYDKKNRAIILENTFIYSIPVTDDIFKSPDTAGEGYPFNYNLLSSIPVGTSVYILASSEDGLWSLVVSDRSIGWIKKQSAQSVNDAFILTWQTNINHLGLASILQDNVAVVDLHKNLLFSSTMGSLFPISTINQNTINIMIPVFSRNGIAKISIANVAKATTAILPLPLSKANLRRIIKNTINKPYGWGNLQNYRDCSAELKTIYTYFGMYIPRNSKVQADVLGISKDYSNLSPEQRYQELKIEGIPFLTYIYIDGHIMLYAGNYQINKSNVLMSYQQVWGLKNKENTKRFIIGKSMFFPLKLQYPEQKDALSLFSKPTFKLINLYKFKDSNIKLSLTNLLY